MDKFEYDYNDSKKALESYSEMCDSCNRKYTKLKKKANDLLDGLTELLDSVDDIEFFADENYVNPHGEYVDDSDWRVKLRKKYQPKSDLLEEIKEWAEDLSETLCED